MVSKSKHLTQWKHNRSFIERIDPDYSDWIITVSFYAALHIVDAPLEHDKVRSITNHNARNDVLAKTNRYKRINRAYYPLLSVVTNHTLRC